MSPVLEAHAVQSDVEHSQVASRRLVPMPWVWSPSRTEALPRSAEARAEAMRRTANVIGAAVLLVVALPVMVLIALLVRLTSPGPVIYVQTRVGIDRRRGEPPAEILEKRRFDYGGKLFQIYKFRTMVWEADATVQSWARRGDPRITKLGRVLRRYRLDELPQLINVLKGEMNLVGPRPEQPKLFVELRKQIEGYTERQRVLPGITGWAQVNHGYDASLEDVRSKLNYDLDYIGRASVAADLVILLRTLPVMLFQRGAL